MIVRLYTYLLRLYPRPFRETFAQEMTDIFALALSEARRESMGLFWGIVCWELLHLPLSVLHEWRTDTTMPHILKRITFSPKLVRRCMIMLFILFSLYAVLGIAAYFAYDLRAHSLENTYTWFYGFDDNPAFISNILPISLLVLMVWFSAPVILLLCGGIVAFTLLADWRTMLPRRRLILLAALLAGFSVVLTMPTPIGYVVGLWFYD